MRCSLFAVLIAVASGCGNPTPNPPERSDGGSAVDSGSTVQDAGLPASYSGTTRLGGRDRIP